MQRGQRSIIPPIAYIHMKHSTTIQWRRLPVCKDQSFQLNRSNYPQDFVHMNKSYISLLAKNHSVFEPFLLLIKNFHSKIYPVLKLPTCISPSAAFNREKDRSRISLAPKCNHWHNSQSSVEISPISLRIKQRHPGLSSRGTKHPPLVITQKHPIFWDRLL